MGLILGGVSFTDFEVPARITFGGDQTLAVHRLQGGARVVDALGPDDGDISWNGIISGSDATRRAQELDQLRLAGSALQLSWDTFNYTVVIATLQFSFANAWWIPYEIRCLVVDDPNASLTGVMTSLLAAVNADLASASSYIDVSNAMGAVAAAGSDGPGTTTYAAALLAISTTYQAVSAAVQSAAYFDSNDIAGSVSLAASLAGLTAARGYVARAGVNYAQMG